MRIKVLICALMLTLTSLPGMASAKNTSDEQLRACLAELGVLRWTPMSKVSKGAFVYSLAGFLYDDTEQFSTAEQAAKRMGLISPVEKLNENERITTKDALKFAVTVLGYRPEMGEEEYSSVAAKMGITSGVSLSNKYLENDDGVQILENMLRAEPISGYIDGYGKMVYIPASGETLLSENRDIYKINGIVTANSKTSIHSESGTIDGIIKIGETEYIYTGDEDFLGNHVDAYIRENKNGAEDSEVVWIGATDKNDYLTVNVKDVFEVSEDFTKIRYYDGSRQKNAELAYSPKVIYNGIFLGSYDIPDFMGDTGSLELIDYDSDGRFDVVFITKYETVVVSTVDYSDNKITNKYAYENALPFFEIEDEDYCEVFKNNEKINISDINTGDVLSVAISKNTSERCIVIHVSDRKVEGILNGRDDDEMLFSVDGKDYTVTESFMNYMKHENKSLILGKEYNFLVDAFGNLADFEKIAEVGYILGLKVVEDEDIDSYSLIYMDMDGDWHKGIFAEKMKLNESLSGSGKEIYNALKTMEPQIMIINVNSNGEIKTIETAINSGTYNEDRLTKYESSRIYRSQSLSFDHSVHLENDAKLVFFPKNVSYDKDDYYVKDASGYFTSDGTYTVTVYDIDEFNFTPLLSVKGTGSKLSKTLFIVTKVAQELGSDEEVHSVVYGNIGSYRDFIFASKNEKFVDGDGNVLDIKPGDVINVSVDRNGYVDETAVIFSLDEAFVPQGSIAHNSNSVIFGTIDEIDLGKGRMRVRAGGVEYVALSSSIPVQVYNRSENTCELRTISELRKDDKIVMQFNWGAPTACVVVRD